MTEATRDGLPERIGKYRILDRLGKGAMGVVYAARDDMMDRTVALKLMMTDLEADPQARARFYREARVAGQLLHRNIVTVFDLGEDNGRPYIVMELLRGAPLSEYLGQPEARFLESRLDLLVQLCEGLSTAHAKGIIHRDIKPGNLFVQTDGVFKILDFGLARLPTSTITVGGLVMGTPDYMSPEQGRGAKVDERSDIFSAAAVSYYVLSGRKPFAARDLPGTLRKLAQEAPPPLEDHEAPAELAGIVFRALEKDPSQRYQRIDEMLADLARFRRHYDAETVRLVDTAMALAGEVGPLAQAYGELAERLGLAQEGAGPAEALAGLPRQFQGAVDPDAATVVLAPLKRAQIVDVLAQLEPRRAILEAELLQLRAATEALDGGEQAAAAGDLTLALSRLEAGARALPASPAIQQAIGRCRQMIAERQARAERISSRLAASRAAAEAANWDEVIRLCNEVLALETNQTEAVERREQARQALERRAAERAAQLRQRLDHAREALASGAFDRAMAHLEEARAVDPGAEAIGILTRDVEAARARAEAAAEVLRRAGTAIAAARTSFAGGRRTEALKLLQRFLESVPAVPSEGALPAPVAEVSRELARLTAEAAAAAEAERREAEITRHVQTARTAWETGDAQSALLAARAVLALDPIHAVARHLEAQAAVRLRELADIEGRAVEARSFVSRGRALLASGKRPAAIQEAEQAVILDPSNEDARALLFDALRLEAEARAAERRLIFEREQAKESGGGRPAAPSPPAAAPHLPSETGGPIPEVRGPSASTRIWRQVRDARCTVQARLEGAWVRLRRAAAGRRAPAPREAVAVPPALPQDSHAPRVHDAAGPAGPRRWFFWSLAAAVIVLAAAGALILARTAGWFPFSAPSAPVVPEQAALDSRSLGSVADLPGVEPEMPAPPVARPEPVPAPPPPFPLLEQVPGETDDARFARSQRLYEHYAQAREALGKGSYQKAISLLGEIVRAHPRYESAADLLDEARREVRRLAEEVFATGQRLEQGGDRPAALVQYERARQIDPSDQDVVDAIRTLRAAMTTEGEELYSRARQMDAVGLRTGAIDLYERALKLLPPDDERSRLAAERLRVLKGKLPDTVQVRARPDIGRGASRVGRPQ